MLKSPRSLTVYILIGNGGEGGDVFNYFISGKFLPGISKLQ